MANGGPTDGGADGGGWREILGHLEKAANNLMTLEITTTVVGNQPKEIKTKIDLLQGDISNTLDEAFLRDEELKPIRDFHAGQVEKGQAIIKGNVDVIVDLAKQLRNIG